MEKPPKGKLPAPQERLELLLLGLSKAAPVTKLCEQAGVSRELFYRWMRALRESGLKALEAKAPGPKAIEPETAERELKKARERIERLEAETARLRAERDRQALVASVAKRIIRRRGWGESPEPEGKKNGKGRRRRGRPAEPSGSSSGPPGPRPEPMPNAGESTAARTGGGSPGESGPTGEGA